MACQGEERPPLTGRLDSATVVDKAGKQSPAFPPFLILAFYPVWRLLIIRDRPQARGNISAVRRLFSFCRHAAETLLFVFSLENQSYF